MDAVEFGGDAVLQECRLRLSLDLFFNLAVYQLVALRQSNPLQRIGSRYLGLGHLRQKQDGNEGQTPVNDS